MFCPKCGSQNTDDAAFCGSCGAPLVSAAAAAAASTAAAAAVAPRAKGGSKKPIAIIAAVVVAIIIIAGVIFGVMTCSGGSDKLTPGIYQCTDQYGEMDKLVIGEQNTVTYSCYSSSGSAYSPGFLGLSGKSISGTYEAADKQGDSTIYDVSNIHSETGAYIDENGVVHEEDGDRHGSTTVETLQFMVPRGGTTGNVTGQWGFLEDAISSDGTHITGVAMVDVKKDGTGVAYTLSKSDTLETPTFDIKTLAADPNTYSRNFTWKELSDGTYQIATVDGYSTFTITMPTKK